MSIGKLWDWVELTGSLSTPKATFTKADINRLQVKSVLGYTCTLDEYDGVSTVGPTVEAAIRSALQIIDADTEVRKLTADQELSLEGFSSISELHNSTIKITRTVCTVTNSVLFTLITSGRVWHYTVYKSGCMMCEKEAPDLIENLQSVAKCQQMVFDSHQDTTADLLHILQVKHSDDFCEYIENMLRTLGDSDFNERVRQYILNDVGVRA